MRRKVLIVVAIGTDEVSFFAGEREWLHRLARQRIRDGEARIAAMRHRCTDRDDLSGVEMVLRMLSLVTTQTGMLIDRELRWSTDGPDDGSEDPVDMVRSALLQLEQIYGSGFEALIAPPERELAALVQPYIRLARAVTRDDSAELIFESGETLAYSVWPDVFEDVRKGIEALAPFLQQTVEDLPPLALITYPGRSDSDTLMHTVIAHEVSHLALIKAREDPENRLNAVFETKMDEAGIYEPDVDRLGSWLDEMLSDAMAIRIAGPAFFFGLFEYLVPTHSFDPTADIVEIEDDDELEDEADDVHPPPAWRLARLIGPAAKFFSDRTDPHIKRGGEVFDKCAELVPKHSDEESHELTVLGAVLDALEPDLETLVGRGSYPEGRFRRDVPLVWERLSEEMAPAERIKGRRLKDRALTEDAVPRESDDREEKPLGTEWSEAIDWRSILNGGYLHYLHGILVAQDPHDEAEEWRRTRGYNNSLTRAGIELSELHRRMIELKKQFDGLNDPR